MRKIKNPWQGKSGYYCFGCSKENPTGLKMEFYEDGDDVVCYWSPRAEYQGWINTLHGGIQATLLDECAAWVITRKLQTTGVTSKLEVKYKKPLMTTESQLTIRARITDQKRNIVFLHATIENSMGEICSEAEAIYYTASQEKARELGFEGCEIEGDEISL